MSSCLFPVIKGLRTKNYLLQIFLINAGLSPQVFLTLQRGFCSFYLFKKGREQKREKEGMEGEEERKAVALAERVFQKEIGVHHF